MVYSRTFFRGSSLPSTKRLLVLLAAALIVTSAPSPAAKAARKPANPDLWSPDVLVLVMTGLAGPGAQQVCINYTTEIPEAEAKQDLERLALARGWRLTNARIETKADSTPGSKPTTSSVFDTRGIVDSHAGAVWLEPFVLSLKRFKTIEVNYINLPEMEFHGLKDFDNRFVKIDMKPGVNSYTYRVTVKDSNFDRLDLPLVVKEVKADSAVPKSGGPRIMLIIGLAILGAAAAYFVTVRVTRNRKS